MTSPVFKDGVYEFPTLKYKGSNCKERYWQVKVELNERTNTASIFKIYGLIEGKQQITAPTKVKGKNIGRANETTSLEQALKMALKMHIDQKNKYTINKSMPIPVALRNRDKVEALYPLYAQEKRDGVRAVVYKDEKGDIKAYSRRKKPIILNPSILRDLKLLPNWNGEYLDCELFAEGKDFQTISGWVKKPVGRLKLYVFDNFKIDSKELFTQRATFNIPDSLKFVKKVPYVKVSNPEEENRFYKRAIKTYEGIVLRRDLPYEYSFCKEIRSKNVLKRKPYKDAEYKLIDYKVGQGKEKNAIIWILEANGHPFSVRPKMSLKERIHIYKDIKKNGFSKYKHKMLTVRYLRLSKKGIPMEPIAKAFRIHD